MTIDYSVPGKVLFKMHEYVQQMLDECPEYLGGGGGVDPGVVKTVRGE